MILAIQYWLYKLQYWLYDIGYRIGLQSWATELSKSIGQALVRHWASIRQTTR